MKHRTQKASNRIRFSKNEEPKGYPKRGSSDNPFGIDELSSPAGLSFFAPEPTKKTKKSKKFKEDFSWQDDPYYGQYQGGD